MWSLSLLLAFCLCVSSQIYTEDDLEQWVWIKGRYEDDEPTPRQYFQVFVRDRIGVYASANFNIFSPSGTEDDGEDWYVGFSYNFDQVTHNISSHYITWSLDDEYWSDAGVQPENYDDYDVGVDGYGETYSSINYFNTNDGELWAYHAFVHADDVDERYPDPITFEGNSLLYRWTGSNFEDEPTYTVYSQQATTRSMYFNTPDGREYLWTANFEEPYTRDGTPNCTLHEYGTFDGDTSGNDGGWRMVYGTNWNGNFNGNGNGNGFNGWYFNCSKFPRAPLVFTTEDDQWLYMDVTYATATWNVDGSLATMSTTGIQQNRWWSEDDNFNNGNNNNNGYLDFGYLDVMDNLYFDNVNTVDHFVASGFDYLIAMNDVGISTWRMHWVTHRAQELPFLQTVRPPTHAWLFNFLDHTCMSVSLGQYTGLNAVNGNSIQDQYFEIYCWDDIHDRWNLAIRIPSFGVIKTQTFMDDGRLFLVALSNVDHPAQNTFITYELEQWYDDDYIVTREVEIDDYEMYWKIVDMHEILDDLHHYKNMIIATLSLLATVFVLQIILLLKGL